MEAFFHAIKRSPSSRPPYDIEAIVAIVHEAQDTLKRLKSDTPCDLDAVATNIEMLEAFGTIAYQTMSMTSLVGKNATDEQVKFVESIPETIMDMKEHLFRRLKLPEIVEPRTNGAHLCQYCYWVLSHLDACLRPKHSYFIDIDNFTAGYLRAANYSPTQGQLHTKCGFCQLLKTTLLADIYDSPVNVWILFRYSKDETTTNGTTREYKDPRRRPSLRYSTIIILNGMFSALVRRDFMLESEHGKSDMLNSTYIL